MKRYIFIIAFVIISFRFVHSLYADVQNGTSLMPNSVECYSNIKFTYGDGTYFFKFGTYLPDDQKTLANGSYNKLYTVYDSNLKILYLVYGRYYYIDTHLPSDYYLYYDYSFTKFDKNLDYFDTHYNLKTKIKHDDYGSANRKIRSYLDRYEFRFQGFEIDGNFTNVISKSIVVGKNNRPFRVSYAIINGVSSVSGDNVYRSSIENFINCLKNDQFYSITANNSKVYNITYFQDGVFGNLNRIFGNYS